MCFKEKAPRVQFPEAAPPQPSPASVQPHLLRHSTPPKEKVLTAVGGSTAEVEMQYVCEALTYTSFTRHLRVRIQIATNLLAHPRSTARITCRHAHHPRHCRRWLDHTTAICLAV